MYFVPQSHVLIVILVYTYTCTIVAVVIPGAGLQLRQNAGCSALKNTCSAVVVPTAPLLADMELGHQHLSHYSQLYS